MVQVKSEMTGFWGMAVFSNIPPEICGSLEFFPDGWIFRSHHQLQ